MKFDAEFDGAAQHPDAFVAVGRRAPHALAGQAHGAEAEPVDGQVAAESEGSGCLGRSVVVVTLATVRDRMRAAHRGVAS